MRYRADWRTLAFIGTYFGLVAVGYLLPWSTSWFVLVPLVVATASFSFFCAVATHNTLHSPIFRGRLANKVMQCVLTVTYGHPVSAYVPGHNLSHHQHTQTRMDVMRTTKVRFKWNLLNAIFFMPTVALAIMPTDARFAKTMKARNPRWYKQLRIEWACYFVYVAFLLALDWKKFLIFGVIPHQYAAWGIITMNLLQHDGTDQNSKYNHSRNFVGSVVNWFTFNNGYHSIHHDHPALHWSLLPKAHAEQIAPHIHPALEQKSLVGYCFRTFFWPGKRLNYDGTAMVLPQEGPDEDWIAPLVNRGLPR